MLAKDEDSTHLVDCAGSGAEGKCCIIWFWFKELCSSLSESLRGSLRGPFPGFCTAQELDKLKSTSVVDDKTPVIETDSLEHFGRR